MSVEKLKNLPAEVRMSHFKNLVAAASADGELAEEERAVLGFVSQKWGLSQREIDQVYSSPDSIEAVVTDDRTVSFHQLYDVVEMAIIDGKLKRDENLFCRGIARQLGYGDEDVDAIIQGILAGNQAGLSEAEIQRSLQQNLG